MKASSKIIGGKKLMDNLETIITNRHVGKNGNVLKNFPADEIKVCIPNVNSVVNIRPWTETTGKNIGEIIENIKTIKAAFDIEITYKKEAAYKIYAAYRYNGSIYIFELHLKLLVFDNQFTNCCCSYVPTAVFKVDDSLSDTIAIVGIDGVTYEFVEENLNDLKKIE